MPAAKKLIEVALPLEAINQASAREKSIRHGHPSTLHLWWARRPLAAAPRRHLCVRWWTTPTMNMRRRPSSMPAAGWAGASMWMPAATVRACVCLTSLSGWSNGKTPPTRIR